MFKVQARVLCCFLSLIFLFISLPITAASHLKPSVKKNKNLNVGRCCEKLAYDKVSKIYDKEEKTIFRNVLYKSRSTRGELDLVVLDIKTEKVEVVFEVKCKRKIRKAVSQAKKQLQRFSDLFHDFSIYNIAFDLQFIQPRDFQRTTQYQLSLQNFTNPIDYKIISYKNELSTELNFLELDYTLEEIYLLDAA